MAANDDIEARQIRSLDDLLEPLYASLKPRQEWRIGTESEKHAIEPSGRPLSFDGGKALEAERVPSVVTVLTKLTRLGWTPYREDGQGPVISLLRDHASITLEPGAQLELSGAPLRTIHETAEEITRHAGELRPIDRELGIVWLGLGFHPLARRDELPWVPKSRYPIMREYLPTRGALALDMMLRTCTVQANLDYASEEDAMRKLRVSLTIQPIVTAMFANSPFVEGHATGERSHRAAVWLAVDPDRSGLLPFAWKKNARFVDYVEWALDVPMFLIKHHGRVLKNTGQTFRSFWKDGWQGERATSEDWLTHLNTLFPEVRLKKTIEMRGADAQNAELLPALPALWKGLMYDANALSALESLASTLTYEEVESSRPSIAKDGFRAKLANRPVGEWAEGVLALAERGLAAIADRDANGRDETIHLAPLRKLIERGQTPADALLEKIDLAQPLLPQLLEHAAL